MATLLAFDTATERMSLALAAHGRMWLREGEGGAQASATIVGAVMALLGEAGVSLHDLDAIAFGRGPGAFTGIRTACSVAQGLAMGAGKPVLPVDSLLAVAEDAREGDGPQRIWAVADARMGEIYAAEYAFAGGFWNAGVPPMLVTPQQLNERWSAQVPQVVAGSALGAFADVLQTRGARCVPGAAPRAAALMSVAQSVWLRDAAVDAALALPLYVRDKVAQTTAEREAARAERGVVDDAARRGR